MKKLKIAFVVPAFPVTTETFITNQIIYLLQKGHEVSIFSLNKNEDAIIHQALHDYNLVNKTHYRYDSHTSKLKRFFPFTSFLFNQFGNVSLPKLINNFNFIKYGKNALNLRFYYKYKWILDHAGFDIIHAHFGEVGAYVARIKALGFLSRTKLVTTFHGYDLSPNLLMSLKVQYKILFKTTDLLTVNTAYTYSLLKKITNYSNIGILPVGLDTEKFRKTGRKRSDLFRLLFVGRLIEFKAPLVTVEILKILIERGYEEIKLIIIGDGKMKKELQDLIYQWRLQSFVEIKGAMVQEAIKEVMTTTDVLICPGIHDRNGRAETQGLVIQEAQAMEIPVVVSDAGGMKYGLLEGETGYIIKEGNIKEFADKIEYLMLNPDVRARMGKRGRKFVKKNFDSRIVGNKLESFYFEIL